MDYEVRVTQDVERKVEEILDYLVYTLQNPQAAQHFLNDFDQAESRLSKIAGNLKLCDNFRLKQLGYHRINFNSMNYFMLYRIEGNTAVIDGVFHAVQDYENKMK